mmetsp:Transcript_27788/g.65312  ORF Transcript_27788/g.65312 Transcript_27788/m.65312 type:complete len:265 (-) Transcript_27788:703-1497(-)
MLPKPPPFRTLDLLIDIDRRILLLLLLRVDVSLRDVVVQLVHGVFVFGGHVGILRPGVFVVIPGVVDEALFAGAVVSVSEVFVGFRVRAIPQGTLRLFLADAATTSDVDGPVHLQEAIAVGDSGTQVVRGGVGVIQTISLILVVEVLVRVRESVAMTQLVTHGVEALVVIGIQQVVFVHFRDTRLDDALRDRFQNLVDAQPSRFTVISVANLHDAVDIAAGVVDFDPSAGQHQHLRVAPVVPVAHGLRVLRGPGIVQGVQELQV